MSSISIVIPTRSRSSYLEVALASIAPQASRLGAEVVVVDDEGPSPDRRALVERHGARYEAHPGPRGLNIARNTAVRASTGDVVVFVDDDVEVAPGWLEALARAFADHPRIEVFTGPIRPRLEGRPPRSCGREGAPITSLDLGDVDTDRVTYAWGTNMAIRREALRRVGPFDERLVNAGDEQEWQERLRRQGGGPILYVATAAVDHRRCPRDSRLRALIAGAHRRGRASRAFDVFRGQAPTRSREIGTLAACLAHVLRRRCPAGLTMVAHSVGRLQESLEVLPGPPVVADLPQDPTSVLDPTDPATAGPPVVADPPQGSAAVLDPTDPATAGPPADPTAVPNPANPTVDDFLSGSSGEVGGLDALRRGLLDRLIDVRDVATGSRRRITVAARQHPPRRRVAVLSVQRPQYRDLARSAQAEMMGSRHDIRIHTCPPDGLGKFENLNRLLSDHPVGDSDWLMIVDDDVVLPRDFIDRLLFLAERFSLDLVQPAHRARSHAAWDVTRRRPHSIVRETAFVEIGPVTALHRHTFSDLIPFPPLRMGWGLDLHWSALARRNGWRCGVVDAVAIGHAHAPTATSYSRESAIAEARAFLAGHPYITAREAQQTLTTHRGW